MTHFVSYIISGSSCVCPMLCVSLCVSCDIHVISLIASYEQCMLLVLACVVHSCTGKLLVWRSSFHSRGHHLLRGEGAAGNLVDSCFATCRSLGSERQQYKALRQKHAVVCVSVMLPWGWQGARQNKKCCVILEEVRYCTILPRMKS